MQRDLDLVREILLAVEKHEKMNGAALIWNNLELDNRTQAEVVFHINLLKEAGYLKLVKSSLASEGEDLMPLILRLTWDGCEFLDAARDDKRWAQAKEIAGQVGSFAFGLLGPLLMDLARQAILSKLPGLSPTLPR
jgi:hypothetical protein